MNTNTKLKLTFNSIVLAYMYGHTMNSLKFSEEFEKRPDFTYWMNLTYIGYVLAVTIFAISTGYIWKTRDRKKDTITEQEKQRRYTCLLEWILAYYFSSIFMVLYTNTMENNEIKIFYAYAVYYLLFVCIGVCTFLYGKTRIFLIKEEEENIVSFVLDSIIIISTTFPSLSHDPLRSVIIYSILISIPFLYTAYQCFMSSSLQNIFKKKRE